MIYIEEIIFFAARLVLTMKIFWSNFRKSIVIWSKENNLRLFSNLNINMKNCIYFKYSKYFNKKRVEILANFKWRPIRFDILHLWKQNIIFKEKKNKNIIGNFIYKDTFWITTIQLQQKKHFRNLKKWKL